MSSSTSFLCETTYQVTRMYLLVKYLHFACKSLNFLPPFAAADDTVPENEKEADVKRKATLETLMAHHYLFLLIGNYFPYFQSALSRVQTALPWWHIISLAQIGNYLLWIGCTLCQFAYGYLWAINIDETHSIDHLVVRMEINASIIILMGKMNVDGIILKSI